MINHRSMHWAQFKDPISHMCLARAVVASVADPGGGAEGAMAPPGPVKIGHKKDGHIDFMFLGPPLPGRWIRY